MTESLSGGCIIADKDEHIIFVNEIAQSILEPINLDEFSFSDAKEFLKSYGYDILQTDKHKILWLNGNVEGSFLSNILLGSFDEFFVCDGKGRAIYCNSVFENNYGISASDIIGKPVTDMVEKGCMDYSLTPEIIKNKKSITYEQHTCAGKTILNTSVPILDSKGDVSLIIENCRDITELNKLKNNFSAVKSQYQTLTDYSNFKAGISCGPTFVSRQMHEVKQTIENMAIRDITMLLLGESGTGKSTLAKCIYKKSPRANGPFVCINCSTIPEPLIESELFGYEKGAFTGAVSSGKPGLIEAANYGTLFFDEIGELSLAMQVKLLELIQEHTYLPVGATKKKYLDARFIFATNQDLFEMVKEKKFREDLFYRLSVATIAIPPIRERPDDIEVLIEYYMRIFTSKHNLKLDLPADVKNILLNYSYPGNIRELENLIEFLVLNNYNNKSISVESLPVSILSSVKADAIKNTSSMKKSISLDAILEDEEERIVKEYYPYNKSSYKLAKALNISQSRAYRLMRKYIEPKQSKTDKDVY